MLKKALHGLFQLAPCGAWQGVFQRPAELRGLYIRFQGIAAVNGVDWFAVHSPPAGWARVLPRRDGSEIMNTRPAQGDRADVTAGDSMNSTGDPIDDSGATARHAPTVPGIAGTPPTELSIARTLCLKAYVDNRRPRLRSGNHGLYLIRKDVVGLSTI